MNLTSTLGAALLAVSLQSPADPLLGTFTLDPSRSDDPGKPIEQIVQSVNRFARSRARGRLSEAMAPAAELQIEMDGGAYVLTVGDRSPLRIVPGGEAVQTTTANGDRASVRATVDGDSLLLAVEAVRGGRTQVFTPIEGGLRVETTYDVEVVAEPVTLRAFYRRTVG